MIIIIIKINVSGCVCILTSCSLTQLRDFSGFLGFGMFFFLRRMVAYPALIRPTAASVSIPSVLPASIGAAHTRSRGRWRNSHWWRGRRRGMGDHRYHHRRKVTDINILLLQSSLQLLTACLQFLYLAI